jgi:predicted secreted protein
MKTRSAISTAALSALIFVGLSSRAQEANTSQEAATQQQAPSSQEASTPQEATTPAAAPAGDNAAASPQPAAPASSNSKVRIVRLSEIKGEVQVDRQTGKGYESAMPNLPVVEGSKLKTGNGVAEVEFEDNSTVRLAQNSEVEFPRLELLRSGAKASSVNVLQGTVYVSLINTKGNEFIVKFGQQTINLPPDSHVRLQLAPSEANLAVMHGDAIVEQPSGNTTVGKNKTMTFNLAGQNPPVIAKSVVEQPLDKWDSDAVQYHKSYANASSFGNSPYSYGINDMNYYGSFVNASGCGGGSMWRPYFTSASWDPFGSGAWAYYPSAGYSWVSPYPWGWTPYHYGSWSFCQGLGWGWRPGGAWMGLANNTFASPSGFQNSFATNRPRPPVRPPAAAQSTLVPVNLKAVPASSLGPKDTFVFRSNSAGLGVPRGSLGKLNSFSGQTAQRGMATTNVYYGGAQRGGAEVGARSGNLGSGMSAGPAQSPSNRSNSGGSMQSASPAAAASHSSMQSGVGGGGSHGGGGGGGRR